MFARPQRSLRARLATTCAGALCLLALVPAAAPAADPEPGSPEWTARDLANVNRMTTRSQDQLSHPEYTEQMALEGVPRDFDELVDQLQHPTEPVVSLATAVPGARGADIYRWDWEKQGRGIQVPIEYRNRYGARIQGELWAPRAPFRDPVTGENVSKRKFPAVIITEGSVQGYKELYWWAAQGLAEAGYVVMTYDVQGQGSSETFGHDPNTGFYLCGAEGCPGVPFQQEPNFVEGTEDALDWFFSRKNPLRGIVDKRRIGLAGHSLGARAVTAVGNSDKRVDAVVAWDNANLADDETPRVPTMGQNAEGFFWPQAFTEPPEPRNQTYKRFVEAGVPAMQIALRGSTHLEWTYIPYILAASNDGERVAMYYTLAWLDRWLKGQALGRDAKAKRLQRRGNRQIRRGSRRAGKRILRRAREAQRNVKREVRRQRRDSTGRLTARTFDGSADASAIGTGRWVPGKGNVPYKIKGLTVEDRLSFYFDSSYAFGKQRCESILNGC